MRPGRCGGFVGSVCAVVLSACAGQPDPAPPDSAAAGPISGGSDVPSGSVHLDVSCRLEVQEDFQTALALLHSFFYEEARRRFEEVARRDADCAMAWWGVAMTYYHPLWAPPTPDEMAAGVGAVERARAIGGRHPIERGLIDAIDAYYRTFDDTNASGPSAQSCHGPRSQTARADAFRDGLEALKDANPDDLEATVFHALSLLATAPPTDKSYSNQLAAAAILEPLLERYPAHPGIAHYIIHAYDYPTLATRGLAAARRYGSVAPWVPHALHMPSHIYTRLGYWADSIASNVSSAEAARDYTARHYGGAVWYDELHALDYLTYAYLQTAQDRKAEKVLAYVEQIRSFQDPNFAAAYALGAIPARLALERREWREASAVGAPHPHLLAEYPFAAAHVAFARAMGGARSGNLAVARQGVARLAELKASMTAPGSQWWTVQVEIQRLAASGWLARAEGNDEEALRALREAAALEDEAGTHPVTPGQLLPAREQLGDLLMELGRSREALDEYELSLSAFPARLNSHLGAARAAEASGQDATARRHYRVLIEMAGPGDGRRGELAIARAYLGS